MRITNILIQYKIRSVSRVLVLLASFTPILFVINNSKEYTITAVILLILILSIRAILDKLSMDISENEIREYLKIPDYDDEIYMVEDIPYKTLDLLLVSSMYYSGTQNFKNKIKDKSYKIYNIKKGMNDEFYYVTLSDKDDHLGMLFNINWLKYGKYFYTKRQLRDDKLKELGI